MAGASSRDDFVSEINVTPFVDVMLVLLIIFMVTAPMMIEGLDVDLPPVRMAETLATEDDHLILTVKSDGSLFLDEYPTSLADLDSLLKNQVLTPRKQLFLRADRNVPYGVVADVMSRTRGAGIHDLGIITMTAPASNAADSAPADSGAPEDAGS
jgi:biopolymer transport protein TolR